MTDYLIGIDEVGRGPLAGPVAVGVVAYAVDEEEKLKNILFEATDSKKMSEKKRERVFDLISNLKKENKVFAKVSFVSANDIDRIGIVPAIQKAMDLSMEKILDEISVKADFSNINLKLDGGLKYDKKIKNQETIIKGDEKEFSISLASIVAKVLRDRKMVDLAEKYTGYFLEKHKGYGTKAHIKAIKEKGPSKIHRMSFLRNIL